ncbi:MAG: DUF885 domain-containing protein [Bacteroidetes bacterium]|nr:DUF885 domain-containing protein [Bacteroidota bacterium]
MNLSRKHIPVIIGLVLLFLLVVRVAVYLWNQSHDESTWFRKVVLVTFDNEPEMLSIEKPAIREELSRYKNRLTDISAEAEKNQAELARNYLTEWEALDHGHSDLDFEAKQKLIKSYLDYLAEHDSFFTYWFPANPYNGVQVTLPSFFSVYHPMDTKEDCKAFIARLKSVDSKINQAIEGIAYRRNLGFIPPPEMITGSIAQIDTFLALPLDENPFYINFSRRVIRINPTEMNEYEAARYLSHISTILDDEIKPSYQKLRTTLEDILTEKGKIAWKGNEACFLHQLSKYYGEVEPVSINHSIGKLETEWEVLRDRLNDKLDQLDLAQVTLADRVEYLNQAYHFKGDSAAELLKTCRLILDDISVKSMGLYQYFSQPVRLEVTSSRMYWHPRRIDLLKRDQTRKDKGALLVDISRYASHPIWKMKSDIYRRGIPGLFVLLKARSEAEEEDFWEILQPMAFRAGWSLYIDDVIANEIMLYSNDPMGEVGYLYNSYLDLLGAMTDISIHSRGWTYQQAREFLLEKAGLTPEDTENLIEISVSDPGQLTAVWLGYQKILELRDQYREKVGNAFILQEFNDFLLQLSPSPWELIEKQLEIEVSLKMAS